MYTDITRQITAVYASQGSRNSTNIALPTSWAKKLPLPCQTAAVMCDELLTFAQRKKLP